MKHILATLAILFTFQAHAADWQESRRIDELFKSAGVDGTFVLYDVSAKTYTGRDRARAERRFVPASTFKIPNTFRTYAFTPNTLSVVPAKAHCCPE